MPMELGDSLLLLGGIAFIYTLMRISNNIGNDPGKRLKFHEDLGVNFPPNASFEEKQRMLDMFGIVPRGTGRQWAYILCAVVMCLCLSFTR